MAVPLVLASASPRRRELLDGLGVSFKVVVADVDESLGFSKRPAPLVEELALRKARAVAERTPEGLVIGADTVVVLRGKILGKPRDEAEARSMLRELEGTSHEVYTGVAVIDAATGKAAVSHERTVVHFRHLTEEEISTYAATGEPADKAGAYAIQGLGSLFVTRIEGCYTNVVGLPLVRLAEMCRIFDYDLLSAAAAGWSGKGWFDVRRVLPDNQANARGTASEGAAGQDGTGGPLGY
ncbi:Maf family protein [Desulforudis sp. 1088]|uniref:Maf family protein n=1 Tax=unclassified Candidatus Desulforudis TaxID=2635950 RepID=UPI003478CC7E